MIRSQVQPQVPGNDQCIRGSQNLLASYPISISSLSTIQDLSNYPLLQVTINETNLPRMLVTTCALSCGWNVFSLSLWFMVVNGTKIGAPNGCPSKSNFRSGLQLTKKPCCNFGSFWQCFLRRDQWPTMSTSPGNVATYNHFEGAQIVSIMC